MDRSCSRAQPIANQTTNTVTFYTVGLGAGVVFPGITNLGIAVNWEGSNDGGTTWIDDNALATSMRHLLVLVHPFPSEPT